MSAYDPYYRLNNIANAKVGWKNATTDEERATYNKIAENERENLRLNGYGYLADLASADGMSAEQAQNLALEYAPVQKVSAKEMQDFDPYYDLKTVVDSKVGWNNATTDEERLNYNRTATEARNRLEAYGYGHLAEAVSAYGADATAARQILEKYAPVAPTSQNDTEEELMTKHNNEVRNKDNTLFTSQQNDRQTMTDKYGRLEETAYSNPFTTAEAKAILGKYDLAGLYGRDNAVASGGASNGGNIDSYAASNALRQQAALTNMGQMAVLEAHNNKINNVKGILSDMGVYLQNQDAGMQNTIMLQQTEAQRLFENGETSKNNEVARQKEYSSISGTVGDKVTKWLNSNIWNDDGSLVNGDVDYQANLNDLQARYDATTDEKERANIWEQMRVLEMARNQKIDEKGLSYGKTYKYQGAPQTRSAVEFDKTDATDRYITDSTNKANVDIANSTNSTNLAIAKGNNATDVTVAGMKVASGSSSGSSSGGSNLTGSKATTAMKNGELNQSLVDAYNKEYDTSYTLTNPPPVYKKAVPMTNSQVKSYFEKLNSGAPGKDKGYKAVNISGSSYSVGNTGAEYVVKAVYSDTSLTNAQKEYLVKDVLGISDSVLNTVANDYSGHHKGQ